MDSSYGTFVARKAAPMAKRAARRPFGSVRRLPSGRWQARYNGPDGRPYTARDGGGRALTFTTKSAADSYLAGVRTDIERGRWVSPDAPKLGAPPTLREYAAGWLAARGLSDRTVEHYQQVARDHLYPAFGDVPLPAITPAAVRTWWAGLAAGPTARAHAYRLLGAIMRTAVADDVIPASPCRVRGAGSAPRASRTEPATLAELQTVVDHTPERYRLMVLLAAWAALRFGELTALTRADVDVARGVVHVRRAVSRTRGGPQVKAPKSEAGKRTVAIPPHLMPLVKAHLREHVAPTRDALLFAASRHGGHLAESGMYRWWCAARAAAGRPDLRFHDLRHTGAVLAAATGATLAELMARLGHSTVHAAMAYQHAAKDRDAAIAAALSELATVTPIGAATKTPARRPAAR
jgi:integrase